MEDEDSFEHGFSQYIKVLRIGSPRADKSIDDMEGEIFVQEKMDGSCARFQHNGDKLLVGSKTQSWELDMDNPDYDKVGSMYIKAFQEIHQKTDFERLEELEEENDANYTMFFENMVLHNLDYNWEQVDQVYFFDVYDEKKEEFVDPVEASRIVEDIGHQFVPHYEMGTVGDINFENYKLPKSNFRDGKPEGVVIKNPKTGIYKKIHRDDFKEINSYAFGTMRGGTDEDRLVNDYCSNNRIIKVLQKEAVENERELTMKDMMGDANVHHKVLEDMWEEEIGNIVHKNWEIDMRKVKKMITRRTKKVLKRRINIKERNDLSDLEALSMRWD